MAGPGLIELDVFFDFLCPFVYRASRLLDDVGRSGEHTLRVDWHYFSLAQVNSKDDGWTAWDAPADERVRGRLAFMAAEAARRQDRFEPFRTLLLDARHRDRRDIDDSKVVEGVAVDAGLEVDRFRSDLTDATILDALERDHRHAVSEHGVFGTPTFVFGSGESAYVRLSEGILADEAGSVFDRLISVGASEPRILEIKRPKKPDSA